MVDGNGKTIAEMILAQVQDVRRAIGALDLKFDSKIDDVHERVNQETAACHKRINPIEREQATQFQKTREHSRAIRWLIWSISALGLAVVSGLIGLALGGGP